MAGFWKTGAPFPERKRIRRRGERKHIRWAGHRRRRLRESSHKAPKSTTQLDCQVGQTFWRSSLGDGSQNQRQIESGSLQQHCMHQMNTSDEWKEMKGLG